MMESIDSRVEAVPASARWFVRVFLAAFVLSAVLRLELWPMTGFLLFSHVRTATETLWAADAVGPAGRESPVWFTELPRAYQGFPFVMQGFSRLSPRNQHATCAAWLAAVRRVRGPVVALRIYRVSRRALPRAGETPNRPTSRRLVYACGS